MAAFGDVFFDATKDGYKIPKERYLPHGLYPIIDQGQNDIAGYSNNSNGLYIDVPAIIFGDHTRIVKYVDVPFFLGADGVKLLKAKNPFANYKYLYYALSAARIPDTGYNRHFKWLKEIDIPLPSSDEQCRIVAILDKITSLITLRKQQFAKLDELVKARFVEMFGEPVANPMAWDVVKLASVTTKIGSGATPKGGKESYQTSGISLIRSMNVYDGFFEYRELAHIDDVQSAQLDNVIVNKDDVLINITGASVARSCVVPDNVLPARVNQHVSIIRCKPSALNYLFLNAQFLNSAYKKKLLSLGEAGGATRQAITKQQLENLEIILPPIKLQKEFFCYAKSIHNKSLTIQKSLDALESLKKSLSQQYFK